LQNSSKQYKNARNYCAVRNFIIREPTAVPKILAASFAPNDHPKNKPLDRKNNVSILQMFYTIRLMAIIESKSATFSAVSDMFSMCKVK
jgi:hypothetical protein